MNAMARARAQQRVFLLFMPFPAVTAVTLSSARERGQRAGGACHESGDRDSATKKILRRSGAGRGTR